MGIKYDAISQSWQAYYSKRHPITKQPRQLRRKGLKSKAEAKRIERELVAELNKRFDAPLVPTWKVAVENLIQDFEDRELTKHTIHDYGSSLRKNTYRYWQDRKINSITTHEIKYLLKVQASEFSQSYKKNILKFIRAVFQHAIERGEISLNPTPKLKFQAPIKMKNVLTESEAKLFLRKARDLNWEWYPHWFLALHTGMRNGELYALTWDKVNFETKQILVNCAWNKHDGFKSTKSGDERIVPINEIELHPFLYKLKSNSESKFVLPRIDCWDKGDQARELRLFLRGCSLPEIRFHDLRATWATLMLSKGVEAIKVMTIGGWKDYKTMMIYIRKAGVDIEGSTNALTLTSRLV